MDNEKFQELVLRQFQGLAGEVKALTQGQARMETHIGNLEEGQKSLTENYQSLAEGQRILTEGQRKLESKVDKLETRIGNIEEGQNEMKSDIVELNKGQLRLETRMENEVIEKIRGLYEFREIQTEVNERILAALDRIEAKIESHDIQISILDKTKSNKRKAK